MSENQKPQTGSNRKPSKERVQRWESTPVPTNEISKGLDKSKSSKGKQPDS